MSESTGTEEKSALGNDKIGKATGKGVRATVVKAQVREKQVSHAL